MQDVFNQVMTMFFVSSILFVSAVIVWLKNNHNSFKEVLHKVTSSNIRYDNQKKIVDELMKDLIALRSTVLKQKTDLELTQEYNNKLREQMQIISRRQKYFRDKLFPQKILVEHTNKEMTKAYESMMKNVAKQMKDF